MTTLDPITSRKAGFAVLYSWRVHRDQEDRFVAAWERITEALKHDRGSLGACLHRGENGVWYSYAQWPSAQARAAAFEQGDVDTEAQASMRDAIVESFPEILMEPVSDLLHVAPLMVPTRQLLTQK